MLIRREVDVGPLDEGYFLYFEEVDFCRRARRAGWRCWYVPGSRVVHLVGASTGVSDPRHKIKRMPDYWFESRRRYFVRNHGLAYAGLADLAKIAGLSLRRCRRILRRRTDPEPPRYLADQIRHSVFLRGPGT
jgi:GT2 family glycosyltransferase